MGNGQNIDLEHLLMERNRKEKYATTKSLIIGGAIILSCLLWFGFTYLQVRQLHLRKDKLDKEILKQKDSLISIQNLRDSFRIEYLEAKGFDKSKRGGLLGESIKANNLLSKLFNNTIPDSTIKIKYYRKSLDQQRFGYHLKN